MNVPVFAKFVTQFCDQFSDVFPDPEKFQNDLLMFVLPAAIVLTSIMLAAAPEKISD